MRKSRKPAQDDGISPHEVASLQEQAENQKRSERAWLSMTDGREDDDGWSAVEENLGERNRQADADRRWKYFGK